MTLFRCHFLVILTIRYMCYNEIMAEIIKFPINPKHSSPETGKDGLELHGSVVDFRRKVELNLKKKKLKACLFEGSPSVVIGGEVIVELFGKRHIGVVTSILQKDKNNNVTKIAYSIPFLSGDDPFKFGEADFTYNVETHD